MAHGQTFSLEGIAQHAPGGTAAVEYQDILRGAAFLLDQLPHPGRHPADSVLAKPARRVEHHRTVGGAQRHGGLIAERFRPADREVGEGHDRAAVAVVDPQRHHFRLRESLFEFQQMGHLRPAEAVDRLPVIADAGEAGVRASQFPQQLHLRGIHVLVFVHQHVTEFFPVVVADIRPFAEQPDRVQDQVVEIERTVAGKQPCVASVELPEEFVEGPDTGFFINFGPGGQLLNAHRPVLELVQNFFGQQEERSQRLRVARLPAFDPVQVGCAAGRWPGQEGRGEGGGELFFEGGEVEQLVAVNFQGSDIF